MATSLALDGLEPTDAVGSVFAGGDETALHEAYDIHSKRIYAFCRQCTHTLHPHDAPGACPGRFSVVDISRTLRYVADPP